MRKNMIYIAFAFGLWYALKKKDVLYLLVDGKWQKIGYVTGVLSINEETGVIAWKYIEKRNDNTKGGVIYAKGEETELRRF